MIKTCTPRKTRGGETRARGLFVGKSDRELGRWTRLKNPRAVMRGTYYRAVLCAVLRGQWPLYFVQYCTCTWIHIILSFLTICWLSTILMDLFTKISNLGVHPTAASSGYIHTCVHVKRQLIKNINRIYDNEQKLNQIRIFKFHDYFLHPNFSTLNISQYNWLQNIWYPVKRVAAHFTLTKESIYQKCQQGHAQFWKQMSPAAF